VGIQTFPVIVHDLRTPLNVIGLSLRMIEQAVPRNDPELEEDLRFVNENFKQIERMLAQLSDYFRLYEVAAPGPLAEFSPSRLLSELVEDRVERPGARPVSLRLDVDPSCPPEAELNQVRARMALLYALTNAAAAADGSGTVRVSARGGPDRWITEIAVDHPPPPSVRPVALRGDQFERLCGTAPERRGMDLAIAARVSELFGGSARLDVAEGRGTTIVLDWPTRLREK
jgi:signal transduction histidine kinase